MSTTIRVTPETHAKLTYGFWGFIFGAAVAMIIGFVWGGWTTSSTTAEIKKQAILASRVAICVAQFIKDPNHEAKLKEFEKTEPYKRYELIRKEGWDKMPGQEKAAWGVSDPCVTGIEALLKASQDASVPAKETVPK